jgi:2-haloacid dehalogenase
MVKLILPDGSPPRRIAAVVFDAYGTLLDVHSAIGRVMRERAAAGAATLAADRAGALSVLWRDKQLAYTWLRNAMRQHADFAQVTEDALDHALEAHRLETDQALREALIAAYRKLEPYPEVPEALARLEALGVPLGVLSNGTPGMLADALASAGIADRLAAVISVETIGVYKPAPEVYQLATRQFGVAAAEILFLSSNGWDVHGAAAFGCTVIHLNRQGAAAERLPGRPVHQLRDLTPLPGLLVGDGQTG